MAVVVETLPAGCVPVECVKAKRNLCVKRDVLSVLQFRKLFNDRVDLFSRVCGADTAA